MVSNTGDDLKSSAQVWGGQEEMRIDDSPPAYSGTTPEPEPSTTTSTTSPRPSLPTRLSRRQTTTTTTQPEPYNPITSLSAWSKTPWHRYVVPDATVSATRTTITTTSILYLNNQQSLVKLLTEQSDLPPMPNLHILGQHKQTVGGPTLKTDFDIHLNLSPLLNLTSVPRWHNKPAHVVPLPGPTGLSPASTTITGSNTAQIEQLARQFLRDKSDRKSFVLTRSVENLPTDVIEGLVRNLIASLNYRGKVTVEFPMVCGKLVVQRRPAGTGAAVGGWFMNVLGLSPDVKYETLERVWRVGVARKSVDGGEGEEDEDREEEGQQSSEADGSDRLVREWWNSWAPAIRDALLLGRQGKLGVEDWIETQMGWRPKARTGDWGVDYA